MTNDRLDALIAHLLNAPERTVHFTKAGDKRVVEPDYLLVEDRDFIVGLLESAAKEE